MICTITECLSDKRLLHDICDLDPPHCFLFIWFVRLILHMLSPKHTKSCMVTGGPWHGPMQPQLPFRQDLSEWHPQWTSVLWALSYYRNLTLLQAFQPMAAQLSKKAAHPLAKSLATASRRSSKTGPWCTLCPHWYGTSGQQHRRIQLGLHRLTNLSFCQLSWIQQNVIC